MVGSPHGSAPELSDSAIQNKTFSLTNAHKKQLGVSLNKRDKLTCVSKLRQLQGPSDQPFSWPFSCSVVYTPFYKTLVNDPPEPPSRPDRQPGFDPAARGARSAPHSWLPAATGPEIQQIRPPIRWQKSVSANRKRNFAPCSWLPAATGPKIQQICHPIRWRQSVSANRN